MRFADLKSARIQHQHRDLETPVYLPSVAGHATNSTFHCPKERPVFPLLLKGFLASFISSFFQQDLLLFLKQHPKLLHQRSSLPVEGEWVRCPKSRPFLTRPSLPLSRCVGAWECEHWWQFPRIVTLSSDTYNPEQTLSLLWFLNVNYSDKGEEGA